MKGKKGKFRYGKMLGITTLVLILGFSIFGVCREISLESAQRNLMAMLEAEQGNYNEDRAVLASTNKKEAQEMAEVFGGTLRITDNERFAVINLPDGVTLMEIAEKEEYRKYHDEIVLDYNNFSIAEVDTDVVDDTEIRSSYQVNDPMYHQQTYIDYLNIGDTWNRTRGTYSDGEKVTVAVIDTGIDTDHPEFIDAEGNSIISTSSYDATNDKVVDQYDISVIEDTDGHGTAVAGVIAAQMNEEGIAGITPEVELLVIKCELDEARHFKSFADIVFAIYYAIEQDVDVINMSLGGDSSKDMASAVQLAKDSDIICVAAAGNDSSAEPLYPAAYDNVIGVGALAKESWEIADYSNYGVNSDIMAPGNALTTDLEGGYSYRDGTSIAAPMVAASVAMYVAQNKYINYEDLKSDLLAAGKDLGDVGEDYYYGFGAIDVAAFVCEEKGLITYDYCTEELETTSQVFVRQHTIQTVPEPERENVVFDDWYYDKSYTRVFDYEKWYDTEFVEDVTLYAKWVNEDDEGASVYNYKTLSDGTIEITGYKGKRRHLTIPEEIDGKMVSSIGEYAFAENHRLKEVVFPTGLVYIKAGAFSEVKNMRKITFLGENLTEIQKKGFYGCTALGKLELPNSVEIIGESAFEGCTSMNAIVITENSKLSNMGEYAFSRTSVESFYIPADVTEDGFGGNVLAFCSNMQKIAVNANNSVFKVEDNTLYTADKTEIVYYPSALADAYNVADEVVTIADYAFAGTKISAIDLNAVEVIGDSAFESAKKLTEIVLPNSVLSLGNSAFSKAAIVRVTLSENLSMISGSAFMDTKLTEVNIPRKVEVIKSSAFKSCSYLRKITFAENSELREIQGVKGQGAFYGCHILGDFELPNSVERIGEEAFYNCRGITKLTIPANVTYIGKSAFRSCSLLGTVDFAEGCRLEEVPEYCFANCTTLYKVSFSDDIIKLGNRAFSDNYLFRELNFSENSRLTMIGDYCFYSCSGLQTMQIPESVTAIGEFSYAFSGLEKVEISKNVMTVGNAAFGACYELMEIEVSENNAVYAAIDNVLFNKDITSVYCVPSSRIGKYSLPETVITVAPYSFYYDILLKRVVLPDGLLDIQQNAFDNCRGMTSIDFPASVYNIGRKAFSNCRELNSITFASGSNIERLGIYTFVNCALSEITIPASVKSMAQYVFYGCDRLQKIIFEEGSQLPYVAAYLFKETSIQTVVFEEGSALKNLQAHAFDGATNLTTIDFGDAELINVDNYAFYGCSKLKEIELPDTVLYIGRYAFYGCSLLEKMHISETIEFIGQNAFNGTNQLKVFFGAEKLPAYVEIDWDNGIAGYFLDVVDYIVNGEWEYAVCGNGTIALSNYNGTEEELEINTLDGYQISRIGAACFRDNDTLTSIALSGNIVAIDDYAFYDCDALKMVELPMAVKRIGNYAFADSIISVSLDKESVLETIGSHAFAGNLTKKLNLPNSVTTIEDSAFCDSALSELVIDEDSMLRTIGTQAFVGTCLEEIYLPNTLENVGVEAFKNVTSLVRVSIAGGDTLLKFSNSAFEGCGAEKFEIPARVYYIGEYALGSCRNLQNIYVISENAYYSSQEGVLCDVAGKTLIQYPCGRNGAYEVPKAINVLNYASFKDAKGLTEVTFENGSIVKTIGWKTFSGCEKLVKIIIPDSVVSFDFYAFENCKSLTAVVLSKNSQLTGVYEGAFYGCVSLENIMLPDCVNEIGEYAFYNCTSLNDFPLTENSVIKGIYDYAFYGCSGIGEIPTLHKLNEIGRYAFAYTNISEYTISENLKSIASDTFVGCENLKNINCDEQNTKYISIQGAVYKKGTTDALDYESLAVWPYGRAIVIGEGKEEITAWDTRNIRIIPNAQFVMADTVKFIADAAFKECVDLHSIDLSNIVKIGNSAFKNCINLKSVYLNEHLLSIEDHVFSGCVNLENIVMPKDVTSIGDAAFLGCVSLKNIVIPETVREIGTQAFSGCYKVANIYYNAIEANDVADMYGTIKEVFDGVGKYVNESNLIIGKNVLKIPAGLFAYSNIANVEFESGSMCKGIGAWAFCSSSVKNISLPKGMYTIGNLAFEGCNRLENLVVPESVTDIESSAFFGCDGLQTAGPIGGDYDYEFGWKAIVPDHAFDGCHQLKDVVFPEGLIDIGEDSTVFRECKQLTNISIPATVENILGSAFSGADIKVVQIKSPEIIRNVESKSSCGYLLDNVDTVVIPSGITDIGSYIKANFTEISIINLNGDDYVTYSNHIHEWSVIEIISEYVECQQDGIRLYNCEKCGVVNYENLSAHSYIETDVSSDEEQGCVNYVCSRCNNKCFTEHNYGEWYSVSENISYKNCQNCDNFTMGDFTTVAAGTCGNNVEWVLKGDGELLIYGTGEIINNSSYSVVPWYKYRDKIYCINIAENITAIGDYSFYGCTKLTNIKMPKGMYKIGKYAFCNCTGLADVDMPDTITKIGEYAFSKCGELKSVNLSMNLPSIRNHMFDGCKKLTTIVMPPNINYIGNSAFLECTELSSITIPDSVEKIDDYAFYDCDSLNEIKIGDRVKNIGLGGVFAYCDNLVNISVSASNKNYCSIEGSLFSKDGTQIFSVPAGLMGEYFVPNTVKYIRNYAFSGCGKLTNISVPNSVQRIDNYAFSGCSKLHDFKMPDNTTKIEQYTFSGCKSLINVEISENVTSIGNSAFEGCASLISVRIPRKVTSIGYGAFKDCASLINVEISENVTTIGSSAFAGCTSLINIEIPENVTSVGGSVFSDCISLVGAKIPQNVTTIGNFMFFNCESLVNVVIPNGVTKIGEYAFSGCKKLDGVEITENVTNIGKHAFNGCTSLKSIRISQGTMKIGDYAFGNCTGLKFIEFVGDAVEISKNAFVQVTAVAYYPINNESWNEDIMMNYGGTITWIGVCSSHEFLEWYDIILKTCTIEGVQQRKCKQCACYEERVIKPTGHVYEKVIILSTCEEGGYTTHTCRVCGDSYVDSEVEALGHDVGQWTTSKEAGCTEAGEAKRSCTRCDYFETKVIEAAGHAYEEEVTEPTCEEVGCTTHTCRACGDSYVDSEVEALGHDVGQWTTSKEANCTEAGEAKRSCTRCDYFETNELEALGHAYEEKVTEPICEEVGYTTHTCKTCGDVHVDGHKEALGHELSEWTTVEEANCTEAGEEKRSCTRCDYFETKVIEATGHAYEEEVTEPTCKEVGYTTHTCNACGDVYVDSEVEALGHELSEWITTKEATCQETGEAKRSCERCDYFETEELEMTGHDYFDGECTVCGALEVYRVFDDVPENAWYKDYVQYVYDNGLMSGSNGLFNPTKDVTRAQLVTTLYRLAGSPEVTDRSALEAFSDVADGQYYTDAICWAYSTGVGTGSNGKFNVTGKLTRQQMATFLFRFAELMGYDTEASADYSDMLNADQVNDYAEDAVAWAVGSGLISGSEKVIDGVKVYDLNPKGNTTRAQLAAILQRFCEGNAL